MSGLHGVDMDTIPMPWKVFWPSRVHSCDPCYHQTTVCNVTDMKQASLQYHNEQHTVCNGLLCHNLQKNLVMTTYQAWSSSQTSDLKTFQFRTGMEIVEIAVEPLEQCCGTLLSASVHLELWFPQMLAGDWVPKPLLTQHYWTLLCLDNVSSHTALCGSVHGSTQLQQQQCGGFHHSGPVRAPSTTSQLKFFEAVWSKHTTFCFPACCDSLMDPAYFWRSRCCMCFSEYT